MDALRAGDPHAASSQVDWSERIEREDDCSVVRAERCCVFRAEVGQGDCQVAWADWAGWCD